MSGNQSEGESSDVGKKTESLEEESTPDDSSAPKKKKNSKEEEAKGASGDDVSVPEGWTRKVVERKSGKTSGRCDVYFYGPTGQKFRSRIEIATYLSESKSPLQIEDFIFSTGPRTKTAGEASTKDDNIPKEQKASKKRKAHAKSHRAKKVKEDSENRSTVAKKSPRKFFPESSPPKDASRSTVAKKQPKRIYVKLFASPKKRILSDFANESLSKEEELEEEEEAAEKEGAERGNAKATVKASPPKRGRAKKSKSSPTKAKQESAVGKPKSPAKLRVQASAKKGRKKKVK